MWFTKAAITRLLISAAQFIAITQTRPAEAPHKSSDSSTIPGEYIIVLKDQLTDSDFAKHTSWASSLDSKSRKRNPVLETYNMDGLKAYHGSFDRETIEKIASNPEVNLTVYYA